MTTTERHWKEYVPEAVSLYHIDRNENLDNDEDLQERCIRQNSLAPLDDSLRDRYHDIYRDSVGRELDGIAARMEVDGMYGEYLNHEMEMAVLIEDRNGSDISGLLIRNSSRTVMFYSLGLEIEGYMEDRCRRRHSEAYWCNRIRQVLRLRKGMYDEQILEMLGGATYGGELRIYFRAMFSELVSENPGKDFRTIRFHGDVTVAIADSRGGSGDHTVLPLDLTLPFMRENLFVDSQVHYSYTREICGMTRDWCGSTQWETGMRPVRRKLNGSLMTGHCRREAAYAETYRKGGCTRGDMDITRHRDVRYSNIFPCGSICPHCGTFWVD